MIKANLSISNLLPFNCLAIIDD